MLSGQEKDGDFEIEFSFYPSPVDIRKFAKIARNIVELYWPENEKAGFEVEVCIMEALTNVFLHAQNDKPVSEISFRLEKQLNKLIVRVFDDGRGFVLAEQLAKKPDVFQSSGRGLFLMDSFMDSIKYTTGKNRNELLIEKLILGSKSV